MKWRTGISQSKEGELYVRGAKLTDLIRAATFPQAVFLTLRGRMPSAAEEAMLNVILVACVEHGVQAPSAFVPRAVASTGNQVNAALAAGMLAIGDWHGGAIEEAARCLQSEKSPKEIVQEATIAGKPVSGLGHKVYKDEDPRTAVIFGKARELGFSDQYIRKIETIRDEIAATTGKRLPVNVDGAIAAIISELGFHWRIGKAFFALGRMPGMIAHIEEEMMNEKPYRRIDDADVEYVGNDFDPR